MGRLGGPGGQERDQAGAEVESVGSRDLFEEREEQQPRRQQQQQTQLRGRREAGQEHEGY